MKNKLSKSNKTIFEQIKQTDENGNEFWNSRKFAKVIEYTDYRNFLKVVDKAIIACKKSGYKPNYHIVEFNDMIEVGKGAKRPTKSLKLSRYACYLIVQNADPSKEIVAQGQTYFAVQTRLQEIRKIFLVNYSKIERRLDPHFYSPKLNYQKPDQKNLRLLSLQETKD